MKFPVIIFFDYFCLRYMELSILIPVYNYSCFAMVEALQKQAAQANICYEIIVADDGSTDKLIVGENKKISDLPNCTYIIREKNVGRASIRNFLAKTSHYEWLLFLDCDLEVPDDFFIERYLKYYDEQVVDGGLSIVGDADALKGNIRYLYEFMSAPNHSVDKRSLNPYKSFRTTNFMIRREVAIAHPFDERFRYYGYEDVLFGKQLKKSNVKIRHIDNPMNLTDYECNEVFISKTEEAMRTLAQFREELRGYSKIITMADTFAHTPMATVIKVWHWMFGKLERKNLTGNRPWAKLFNIYRLGYFLTITK